jgi:uncharacterized membrane protein
MHLQKFLLCESSCLEASQNFRLHNGRQSSISIAHDPSFCYRALSSFKEAPVAFCPTCGTQISDGAGCPKCAGGAVAAAPAGAGLADNVAGALAYVTIIPAIVFLVVEPFNKKRFVRFHAFQCLFFAVAWTVLWIGLSFIAHIPFLGWATVVIWPLVSLVGFVIWLILVLKAYQGQMFKLPVIGDMAEQQAGS